MELPKLRNIADLQNAVDFYPSNWGLTSKADFKELCETGHLIKLNGKTIKYTDFMIDPKKGK